jgi:hypothetical protein
MRVKPMGKCTFCERDAMSGAHLQPPMCEKHHAVAVVISLLKAYAQPVTVRHIREFVTRYPQAGLSPGEVDALYRAMAAAESL